MKIEESDAHGKNTSSPRDESLEPDSNVTVERESHPPKHPSLSCLTEEGMQSFHWGGELQGYNTTGTRYPTSTRTPSKETKFRGKTH
jgi:hypothetical protein